MQEGPQSTKAILRSAIVAGLCAAYLIAMGAEPTSHADTARDILLARDGLATGVYQGCASSFGTFRQGALWVRAIAASLVMGLGPVGQHFAIALWLIAGVTAFDHMVRKHFGSAIDWRSTAIFFALTILAVGYPNLWNPTIASFAVVLLTWALLEVATRGSHVSAVAAGAALALCAEASWSAFMMAPVVGLAVVVACIRPLLGLVGAAIGCLIPSLAWSYPTWVVNSQALLRESWQLPFVAVGGLLGLISGLAMRRRWGALPVESRRRWMIGSMVVSIAALTLAASLLANRLLISPQYLFTALPSAVILTSLALSTGAGTPRRGSVASAITLTILAIPITAAWVWYFGISGGASIPNYSMREAKILADHFYGAGFSFHDVQRHLRGPDSLALMYSIAAYAPDASPQPTRDLADVRVLAGVDRSTLAALPNGVIQRVDLGRRRTARLVPIDGWIGLAPSRVCYSAIEPQTLECAEVPNPSVPISGSFSDLIFPSFPGIYDAYRRFTERVPGQVPTVRWELPINVRGTDSARHVQLASIIAPPWRIERVKGVAFRGRLPSRSVVIERGGGVSGQLVVSAKVTPNREYPPEILETRPQEVAIRRIVEQLPPAGPFICSALDTCP